MTKAKATNDTIKQNQEAANSSVPLDAAAQSQSGESYSDNQGASVAEGSPTQGTNEIAARLDAENEDQLKELSSAVENEVLSRKDGDVASERCMLATIHGFMAAMKSRYDHLLTGMANSTAEAIRCLADAEIHLADHIAQQQPKSEGAE